MVLQDIDKFIILNFTKSQTDQEKDWNHHINSTRYKNIGRFTYIAWKIKDIEESKYNFTILYFLCDKVIFSRIEQFSTDLILQVLYFFRLDHSIAILIMILHFFMDSHTFVIVNHESDEEVIKIEILKPNKPKN